MRQFFYLLILFIPINVIAKDSTSAKPSITETIVYKTAKAGKAYLVWDLDNWKTVPDKKLWPKNTFLKDKMAWSPMEGTKDSFSISLALPKNTSLGFMIWIPIDNEGDSTNGWDTYGSQTYTTEFTENKTLRLGDDALWMPKMGFQFNLFELSPKIFIGTLILAAILMLAFRKRIGFTKKGLIIGLLCSSLIMVSLIRIQMNNLYSKQPFAVFGAIFNDLLWLVLLSIFFLSLMFLSKKICWLKNGLFILYCLLLFTSLVYSIFNIEIVRILGRPVNYQWLYYSNFLAAADAQRAVDSNLSSALILNICSLLGSAIVLSVVLSFLPASTINKIQKPLILLAVVIFCLSFYQSRAVNYQKARVKNPVLELISSAITSQSSAKLFSMKVPDKTKAFIEQYHSLGYKNKFDTNGIINNIILFVFESTPKQFVSLYDSTYDVTPNIKKWRNISRAYTNMYAHLPATVYSMGSINSGVYPYISYLSLVADHPNNSIPSLSGELHQQQWSTSLFFGADLAYSNMGVYAKSHGFDVVEDNTNLPCSFEKFGNSNTFLDQLDDRCLATRYLSWFDKAKADKKFSLLWTTQTHYPYLARNEKKYTDESEAFNRYLNALSESDEAFGMLMDGLKQRGILKNTLVIVTADHGEAFNTHNQSMHASKIYEENVSIPFVMYNPAFFKGETNDQVGGLIDIAPTIMHMIGVKKPVEWQGKSLLEKYNDSRTFFICPFSDFLFGTRKDNWSYIYNGATDKGELYNLKADPKELNNVASLHPEIAKEEFEMIAGWIQYHNRKMRTLLK